MSKKPVTLEVDDATAEADALLAEDDQNTLEMHKLANRPAREEEDGDKYGGGRTLEELEEMEGLPTPVTAISAVRPPKRSRRGY